MGTTVMPLLPEPPARGDLPASSIMLWTAALAARRSNNAELALSIAELSDWTNRFYGWGVADLWQALGHLHALDMAWFSGPDVVTFGSQL